MKRKFLAADFRKGMRRVSCKKNEIITIEKIIPGGSGLGRLTDGLVLMVPKVLPGEKIVATIQQRKKKYAKGVLVEVLDASTLRAPPPCPFFAECGGCDLQHLSYSEQLKLKGELLREQLTDGLLPDDQIDKIIEASNPMAYRQRLKLQVDSVGRLGFFQKNSHKIVPISACLLAEPLINQVLEYLSQSREMRLLLKHTETIELILSQAEQMVFLLVHFLRKPRPLDKTSATEIVRHNKTIGSLTFCPKDMADVGPFDGEGLIDQSSRGGASKINFQVALSDGKQALMSLEVGGFCQVNLKQNEKLIQTMLSWAAIKEGETLLDLYCGMGNFSVPAAIVGAQVTGTDIQRSAIRSAERNALQNGLDSCCFIAQNAEDSARDLVDSGRSFDLVLLDPPRQGCRAVVPYLAKIAAGRIIYVSCDPATLRRDLFEIVAGGFQIEKIQAVDMFPQTHHLETIVMLKKKIVT